MKVYLVRHGETNNNSRRVHQDGSAELSEVGIRQAKELSKRFQNIQIDKIISSPFERAKKTAEIISLSKNIDIEFSDLFVERKRPSEIENQPADDESVLSIKNELDKNYNDTSWHYSDEENAEDIKNRALKALKFLENQREESVLVVTHGLIMRTILGVMIFGQDMTPKESKKLQNFLHNTNTGITVCEFSEQTWKLVTWNDFAHLGE